MGNRIKRIEQLEARLPQQRRRWWRVLVGAGEPVQPAIDAQAPDRGDDDGIIVRRIVKPRRDEGGTAS